MKRMILIILLMCLTVHAGSIYTGDSIYASSVTGNDGAGNLVKQPKPVPTYIDPLDATAGWSIFNGTLTLDTTNFICSTTGASLKLTKGTANVETSMTKVISAVDVRSGTDTPFALLRAYVHEGTEGQADYYDNQTEIRAFVSSDTFTNFASALFTNDAPSEPGWWTFIIPPSEWNETGSPNWAAITDEKIRHKTTNATDTSANTYDQLTFVNRPTKARICLTFDDCRTTDYEFQAYMVSKGIVGTFYAITSKVGTTDYMTVDQLHLMKDAGHLIANHSHTHAYDLTLSGMISEITQATKWLVDNGFSEGSRIYAQPGGTSQFKQQWKTDVLGVYVDQYRATRLHALEDYPIYDNKFVYTPKFDDLTVATTCLTNAQADKSTYVIGLHTWNINLADFKTFIDAVAAARDAGNIDVITMSELLQTDIWE